VLAYALNAPELLSGQATYNSNNQGTAMKLRMRAVILVLIAGPSVLAGCTGTTVLPSVPHQDVVKKYNTVAVGEITGSDELWHNYTIEIHRALAAQLASSKSFAQVLDPVPMPLATDALVINGHITEVDKGSAAARWIVGFGAGRAHMTAEFELKDANGNRLGTYSVRKTYAGGAGIGGPGFLDMDDLAQKLGQAAGDSLANWVTTGKLESR
jgi:hypothetical protein